jgi:hypothetical protein
MDVFLYILGVGSDYLKVNFSGGDNEAKEVAPSAF